MKGKEKMKNELIMELNVDLKLTIPVDMTEFNQQTLKVEEVGKAKYDYVISKLPNEEIKNIVLNCTKELENLGFKVIKNYTYSRKHDIPELKDFLSLLTNSLTPPKMIIATGK